MKWILLFSTVFAVLFITCSEMNQTENPFYTDYTTPFGIPPFDQIKEEHYLPAIKEGIAREAAEIEAIAGNHEAPTFVNTIEALEKTGELLRKVNDVFYNLKSAHTNDQIEAIAKEASPLLSAHSDNILLNEVLFDRIKEIYNRKDELDLTAEQQQLLQKYYDDFARNGANLGPEEKEKLRKINEELSLLSLQFGENVLKENNRFQLVIDDEADLAGLTSGAISAAAMAAKENGLEGKWLFTLHKPSLIPFLQYSEKRELREKMYKAYINRGDHSDELDNNKILIRMASLRITRANLLGYDTHADYVLEKNMAKTPANVYELLNKLWEPALRVAKAEAAAMQAMIEAEGHDFKLQPWDWWYYAEKIKKARYDLDEQEARPYFALENVRSGIFTLANKLWGISFVKLDNVPKYHEDVTVYEVKEADGSHIGILLTDYFPRASKRGGAWMNDYRGYSNMAGEEVKPIIVNVGNFSKPTGDQPSLLRLEEVETMFHEFGHALHGLLTQATYPRLAGTSVPRDFVELPSQIMENWAFHPEFLKEYARHYQTGEPMPDGLIAKIDNASKFNQGFKTVEYLAASFLDMDWHTLTDTTEQDPDVFEIHSMEKIGLIPEIVSRYRSPYFQHIFAGGYSSGYYSYIWAEVLDADAFEKFKEEGIFNRETGESYRRNILATGGTADPMELYVRFRGSEPQIGPILEKRGLN